MTQKQKKEGFFHKLRRYDGRTAEERAYAIVNHAVDFIITSAIVIAMILGGYSFYINERQLQNASAGYTGYTMEQLGAVGWISIDHTDIDYPVMQGKTNTEYLRKNPLGQVSASGSIFLDSTNSSDFSDPYSVIYGHHMVQGKMFGALDKFHDFSYLKSHASGTLKTRKGKSYPISIYACMSVSARDQTIFDVLDASKKKIEKEAENKTGGKMLAHSLKKRIIALSTCHDAESEERTVVLATVG